MTSVLVPSKANRSAPAPALKLKATGWFSGSLTVMPRYITEPASARVLTLSSAAGTCTVGASLTSSTHTVVRPILSSGSIVHAGGSRQSEARKSRGCWLVSS